MLVSEIVGQFFVPGYQRGYRWGREEVTRLLDDISESSGRKYFLQPVVAKRRDDGKWELVDGQQRLTTLLLILRYIHEHLPTVHPKYSLEYETRPGSADYLDHPAPEQSQDNIDFFHIFGAFSRIREWFESRNDVTLAAINFYKYLSESVYIIWYETPANVESTTLFTRLNVGRIPLTDAELVKALLLTRASELKREREIAAQWDTIERDLRVPELWAFVTGRPSQEATHIMLLLDTLAVWPKGRQRPLFHTFETLRPMIESGAQDTWNKVVGLHSLIMGWYDNRDLFHKIGYLIARGRTFDELTRLNDKGVTPKAGYVHYTVRQAAQDWLAHGLDGRSAKTIKTNQNVLEPILKVIGARKLRELTAADVRKALATMAAGYSTAAVTMGHLALKRAIRPAEANDLIARNVAAWPTPPRASKAGRPSR